MDFSQITMKDVTMDTLGLIVGTAAVVSVGYATVKIFQKFFGPIEVRIVK